jgi:hypothetical protein
MFSVVVSVLDVEAIKAEARERGWMEIGLPKEESLLDLGRVLGEPVSSRRGGPVAEIVLSVPSAQARPSSLSRRHGMGPLPLHTDGAHHVVPPRWVLLRKVAGSDALGQTRLVRTDELRSGHLLRERLLRATCVVRDGPRAFAARVLAEGHGYAYLRWDPGCMTPTGPSDERAIREMVRFLSERCESHDWLDAHALLVDNWAVLHGRSRVRVSYGGRRALERVLVRDGAHR